MSGRIFEPGDRVVITSGPLEGYEGEVQSIDAKSGQVCVGVTIFGRTAPLNLDPRDLDWLDEYDPSE